jgi:YVTN family beta-propeller protein
MVNLTESNTIYGSYITYSNSIANFEYFYSNGTIIPAWIESNSSGKLTTWLKIANTIATNDIYLGFAIKPANLLSSSGTSGIGEAPQLSCPTPSNTLTCDTANPYAEYDDGANVFTNYWNFAGNTLPSGWTGVNYTVNNGVTVNSPVPSSSPFSTEPFTNYINTTSAIYNTTQITEFYFPSGFDFASPCGGQDGIGEGWGLGKAPNTFGSNGISVYNDFHYSGTFFQTALNGASNVSSTFTFNTGSGSECGVTYGPSSFISSMYSTSSNAVFGIGTNPPNYNNAQNAILTKDIYVGDLSISLASYDSNTKIGPIDYIRTRAYPPNGAMPSVTFSAVTNVTALLVYPNPAAYGQSIIITASCALSTDSCAVDYPSLGTKIANGTGSATYTYNAFALAAGTYSSFYANDITAGTNTIGQTLTINKNSTYTLALPNFPANYAYNGINATATANIITYNNQLPANDFLNNALITSFNTSNTITLSAVPGNYIFTANTLGNGNYIAATVSKTLTISKASPVITLPNFPANYAYNGINATVTANIITYGNQLKANDFLNNVLLTSFNTTSNTVTLGPSAGNYIFTANTLGNGNYIAATVSKTLTISKASPLIALPSFPANSVYNGTPKKVFFWTQTYNNQIPSNLYENNALVSNTLTGTISGTISGFVGPWGVAFSPSGAYAYVTNINNGTVSIVNTSTNTITGTITGFDEPYGIAFSPSGAYAYVANYNNNVSIVNTSTNTIIHTITGFDEPYGVAFFPSGAYAYVTNYLNGKVSIVNTSTNTISGTISGFSYPAGVAISPSGAYAYVANYSNTVSIVNTSTNTISGTISGFNGRPEGVAFSPSGAYAYVTNGKVSIVNTSTNTISGTISGFHGPKGVAISPSGAYAYTINGNIGTVSIVLTGTNTYGISAAGTYAFTANTPGNGNYTSNTISKTLTISKATPVITLPNFPANYVYNGINATATANITTYDNQLSANDFLNNVLVTSFDTANTVTLGAAAGNYIFAANTLGNGNYTSNTISKTLTISKAPPVISLLFKNSTGSVSLDTTGAEKTINSTLPFNITASTNTVNNQLNAGIYVNASLNATTNSLKTISFPIGSLSVGKHVITFNSLGNNNYTSFDPSFIINVLAQPSHPGPVINSAFTVENNITLQVSQSVANKVDFENYNTTLKFVTNYTGKANLSIIKETPFSKSYPGCSSVTSVFLINASVGGVPVNVSLPYNSSDARANLVPAICKNDGWEFIKNYTINPYVHTINFTIPSDPIIGLIPSNYTTSTTTSITTSTTVSSTSTTKTTTESTSTIPSVKSTIPPTTTVPTTTIPPQTEKLNDGYIIALIAFAVVLIIIGAYYLIFRHKAGAQTQQKP